MSKIVGDKPCPECRKNGRDKTGNHLIVFEDGGYYCNRCGFSGKGEIPETEAAVPTTKGKKVYKPELPDNEFYKKLPILELTERKISKKAAEFYGIRTALSTKDGTTPEEECYPYLISSANVLHGWKIRRYPKTFYSNKKFKDIPVQFFGQYQYRKGTHKRLLVVGGEDDAAAAWDMFNKSGIKHPPAIVGFPQGECDRPFRDNKKFVSKFEEIVLCADMDEQGEKATKKIIDLLGASKVKVMSISEKDPNDMLKKKKEGEFINAFYEARLWKPTGVLDVQAAKRKAKRMPEWGKDWPWPTMTKLTYGRRLGEGCYIGAGVKIGKSEFVNELLHHIITVDKLRPCVIKPEEEPDMTIRKIAGKIDGKQYHKPDGDFTETELNAAVDAIPDENVQYVYDSYGSVDWEEIKDFIRYCVQDKKCEDVIIDPITCFTDGMQAADVDVLLKKISRELAEMAKDLKFHYYVFCHLNAPASGNKPHEEGGAVKSNQFAGSRAMMRSCYYMFGIERNKRDPDPIKRNTSRFVLLDDRAFGKFGVFEVFYDEDTGRYLEPEIEGDYE